MIYLDYAAATPVSPKALQAMQPYFSELFFNPSSPYLPAKHVREAYESAKNTIAHSIGAKSSDLIMTAGATESINLAFTVLKNLPLHGPEPSFASRPTSNYHASAQKSTPSCLILETEHASVRAAASQYPFKTLKVDKNGQIDFTDFKQKLNNHVALVSVALADNELGTIRPLAEISALIRAERLRRLQQGITTPLYLHSDASQALNLIDVNVARLGVDLLTINAAKVYGPKGIGALYLAHGVPVSPITVGGGQERGLRSGTENVPATIGFAVAAAEAKKHLASARKKYLKLAAELRQILQTASVPPLFLGSPKHQLANFCPVSFPDIDAERLIYKLEMSDVFVATGAACAASKGQKSHVLTAIGLSDAEIAGSLRLTLGDATTSSDIEVAGQAIVAAVNQEAERLSL